MKQNKAKENKNQVAFSVVTTGFLYSLKVIDKQFDKKKKKIEGKKGRENRRMGYKSFDVFFCKLYLYY